MSDGKRNGGRQGGSESSKASVEDASKFEEEMEKVAVQVDGRSSGPAGGNWYWHVRVR